MSQSFPAKIGLSSGITEHSFSHSPEMLKVMPKYQTQMKVTKQLTIFQNLFAIYMMCLSFMFMPNIF